MALISPDPAHQIANAHTVFNLISSLLVLPWTGGFTKLIYWLVPGGRMPKE